VASQDADTVDDACCTSGIVLLKLTHLSAGEGAEYVRLTFGTAGGAATEVDDPSNVIDAEFLFLQGVDSDASVALQGVGYSLLRGTPQNMHPAMVSQRTLLRKGC
jgi:hypothetical protein